MLFSNPKDTAAPAGTMEMLAFARHISSFSPGRVRVRHPGLKSARLARASKERLEALDGVKSVEVNSLTGSALILYDAKKLEKDALIARGLEWARWLEAQM